MCTAPLSLETPYGKLDCGHWEFCFPCISQWAGICNKCPYCNLRFHTITKSVLTSSQPLETVSIQDKDTLNNPDPAFIAYIDQLICVKCKSGQQEETLLICDKCDRGFHTQCVGLDHVPMLEVWFCEQCIGKMTRKVQREQKREMRKARIMKGNRGRKRMKKEQGKEVDYGYCDPEFDRVANSITDL